MLKSYVRYMWNKAVQFVYIHALFYIFFTLLLTLHVTHGDAGFTGLGYAVFLFIYNFLFFINETAEFILMKW